MPTEQFRQGVKQFNQQEFYACHDTLEAIWIEAEEIDKRFYQGILQIAVACYHLHNHNWQGAVILLGEGKKRLKDYQPVYQNIDLTALIADANQLLRGLQQIEPSTISDFVAQLNPERTSGYYLPQIIIRD